MGAGARDLALELPRQASMLLWLKRRLIHVEWFISPSCMCGCVNARVLNFRHMYLDRHVSTEARRPLLSKFAHHITNCNGNEITSRRACVLLSTSGLSLGSL
jgi:hypothetical protein